LNPFWQKLISETQGGSVPLEIYFLLLVLGLLILFWDLFDRKYQSLAEESEISEELDILALKNDDKFPTRSFESDNLRLRGTPDALAKDGKITIPVDFVPLSSKVQDRHVVKLLAYMRLIEEETKLLPPYGVLLMGKKRRVVKVKNSPEKQRWLDTLLDEMDSIIGGVPANPRPKTRTKKMQKM